MGFHRVDAEGPAAEERNISMHGQTPRRTQTRSFIAVAVVFGLIAVGTFTTTLTVTGPAEAIQLSSFEIDGNLTAGDDGGGIDWDSPEVAGNLASVVDPCQATGDAGGDDSGQGGAKIVDAPPSLHSSAVPEFADFCQSWSTWFLDGYDAILCVAWQRTKSEGTNSYFFELNQLDDVYPNGLPVRTPGDLLLEFDDNANNTQINYRFWDGSAYPNGGTVDPTYTQAAMSGDQLFGEACINLSQTVFSPDQCVTFGQMWLFSISGGSLNSRIFDVVMPRSDLGASSCGTITVEKVTQPPGSNQTFTFTLDASGVDAFGTPRPINLTPDPSQSAPIPGGQSFAAWQTNNGNVATGNPDATLLVAGEYTLSEDALPPGWSLTDVTCTEVGLASGQIGPLEPAESIVGADGVVTVNLDPGEDVVCTFTNIEVATLEIVKTTDPAGDPTLFDISIVGANSGEVGPVQVGDGQLVTVEVPGGDTYNVAEIVPAGWALTSATCDNGQSPDALSLAAGDIVRCSFANTLLPTSGTLEIQKQVEPVGATGTFTFAAIDANGVATEFDVVAGAAASIDLDPGIYSIVERAADGWVTSNASCSTGEPPGQLTIVAGEAVSCVFTNVQLAELVVEKVTLPAGDPQIFEFSVTGGAVDATLQAAGGSSDSILVVPGTYSVTEQVLPGWTLDDVSCSGGASADAVTLGAGERAVCTFTNTKDATVQLAKVTDPPADPTEFTIEVAGPGAEEPLLVPISTSAPGEVGLYPGTYSITEQVPFGWFLDGIECGGLDPAALQLEAGAEVVCTITNTKLARVVVQKRTDPAESPQLFTFPLVDRSADVVEATLEARDGEQDETLVYPGLWALSEDVLPRWTLVASTCDNGQDPDDLVLSAGETVICTFDNVQDGTITIIKETATVDSDDEFSFAIQGTSGFATVEIVRGGTSTSISVFPGDYSIAENVPTGWELTGFVCDSGDSPALINVVAGGQVTCTFTNTPQGDLVIVKEIAAEEDDGSEFPFTIVRNDDGLTIREVVLGAGDSDATQVSSASTYSITEDVPAAWELLSATCDNGDDPSAVTVLPATTVTCTFVNGPGDEVLAKTGNDLSFAYAGAGMVSAGVIFVAAGAIVRRRDEEDDPFASGLLESKVGPTGMVPSSLIKL